MEVKFVGAHTLVWTHRVVEHLSGPNKGKTSSEDAFHLCSLKRGGYTANAFAKAVRRHWSVEKYHSRRDGAYCEDIRTRRCNHNVMGAMLIARSATFYFFAESGMTNCQEFKERLQANPDEVFRMVTQQTGRKTNDQN